MCSLLLQQCVACLDDVGKISNRDWKVPKDWIRGTISCKLQQHYNIATLLPGVQLIFDQVIPKISLEMGNDKPIQRLVTLEMGNDKPIQKND